MTISLDALTQPVLIAAVAGLVAGAPGYYIVEVLKRLPSPFRINGAVRLRASAWFVCSVLVAVTQALATKGDYRECIVTILVLSGAGGAAGAVTSHVIREHTRRKARTQIDDK